MEKIYQSPDQGKYQKVQKQSCYLKMRDGVELAVDIWTPKTSQQVKFPTLLHQTRYWRGAKLRWPFSALSDGLIGHEGNIVRELILAGYAFVNVDCRGSGASFGTRPHPWSPEEVKDGNEVADWIIGQAWSDGNIGVVGISYTGTSAEFALTNQHPAIKAAMPLFSLYDVYDDIALPGGIPHDGFVIEWGKANESLDINRLPIKDPIAKILVSGVAQVEKGKKGKTLLQAALAEHSGNLNVHETSKGVEYRDQQPSSKIVESMDDFSPHAHQEAISGKTIPVLTASGWRDGAYPHSSIRRFLNLPEVNRRLLLGPWDHGGKNHISPGKHRKLRTDIIHYGIRFFDHYLKGYDTGLTQELPVKYFTLQEEEWKLAANWPPEGLVNTDFFLGTDHRLLKDSPETNQNVLLIKHNPNQGTGHYTRWRGLRMTLGTGNLYPDRKKRDRLLQVFDSEILQKDVEVTGHGEVSLKIRTNEKEAVFFVYLEDITPGGEIWYVTEGELRGLHRKISQETPPYKDVVAYHSYLKKDAEQIPAGEIVELRFDLLPISYLFKKGHRIRIAIATADIDNFKDLNREGSEFELILGGENGTKVTLPIMPK